MFSKVSILSLHKLINLTLIIRLLSPHRSIRPRTHRCITKVGLNNLKHHLFSTINCKKLNCFITVCLVMIQEHRRMGLIELFFGFKNKRLKKMVLLKVISGLDLLSMLVTGVITANKALVFNTTRVVINMKVCGHLISVTDREPSGEWKTRS